MKDILPLKTESFTILLSNSKNKKPINGVLSIPDYLGVFNLEEWNNGKSKRKEKVHYKEIKKVLNRWHVD